MGNNQFKLLLVEDNIADIHFISEMLTNAAGTEFHIMHTPSLSEARKLLDQNPIDLILLDLNLLDSKGIETFRKLHAHAPSIPVVVLTGSDDNHQGLNTVQEGAQDYLSKNTVSAHRLIQTICYSIERNRLHRELLLRDTILAKEEEQKRIMSDLHDNLGQHLTAIGLFAHSLKKRLSNEQHPEAGAANQIAISAEQAKQEARNLARGLYPQELEQGDLTSALKQLTTRQNQMSDISCVFQSKSTAKPVPNRQISLQLYRIAQEALNNAVSHSHAEQINVILSSSENTLILEIRDNGTGLPASYHTGCGLNTMKYRANLINGQISIQSEQDAGTTVTCTVPQ